MRRTDMGKSKKSEGRIRKASEKIKIPSDVLW